MWDFFPSPKNLLINLLILEFVVVLVLYCSVYFYLCNFVYCFLLFIFSFFLFVCEGSLYILVSIIRSL